jgi:hypothetical protein
MSISVDKLFGLEGGSWMRHANPVSVRTRFAVLPLLVPRPRQTAKAWFIDPMVLLFEHMKGGTPRTPPSSTERASTPLPYFG